MYLIAEIGCNHMGDVDIAEKMVRVAKDCGADGVKFQKRTPKLCLTEEKYNAPHPNPHNSFGKTYGEHREFLELDIEEHRYLRSLCHDLEILYGASVWDDRALREMVSLNPDFIKIPSALNQDYELIANAVNDFPGPLHVSTGMLTDSERRSLIKFLKEKVRTKRINYPVYVLYACTSGYPVKFEDGCLLEIEALKEEHSERYAVGFSGHHLGIAVDIAAMTLGAEYIERHFTLDRTWRGTDHAASLEPSGLAKLARDLKNVKMALGNKPEAGLLDVEAEQRRKLK